jgi:hypothetical protein
MRTELFAVLKSFLRRETRLQNFSLRLCVIQIHISTQQRQLNYLALLTPLIFKTSLIVAQ